MMRKTKKSIAVIAACLLMSSNVSAINFFTDCAASAISYYNYLIDNRPDLSVQQCNDYANAYWDFCDANQQ